MTFYADNARGGRSTLKELASLRGHTIESVAWNYMRRGDERGVGPFLLGTSKGLIFESRLEDGKEKGTSELWNIAASEGGIAIPIVSLRLEPLTQGAEAASRFLVIAVTKKPFRYYQFMGGPRLAAVFSSSRGVNFNEIPGPELPAQTCLQVRGRCTSSAFQ
jgi:hypothetical protein